MIYCPFSTKTDSIEKEKRRLRVFFLSPRTGLECHTGFARIPLSLPSPQGSGKLTLTGSSPCILSGGNGKSALWRFSISPRTGLESHTGFARIPSSLFLRFALSQTCPYRFFALYSVRGEKKKAQTGFFLFSPDRARTCNPPVNSRMLYH